MSTFDEKDWQTLFKHIADDAVMGFLTFNTQTKACVFLNKLGYSLFEVDSQKDIDELRLDSLYLTEARGNSRLFDESLVENEGYFQDVLMKKTNGQMFIANVGVKHLTLKQSPHVVLMIQDITIQKKLQRDLNAKQEEIQSAYEELLGQNIELKRLDAAKDKFMALTTHELRTPAAAMLGSAEILQLGLYDTESELKEFIEMIHEQGKHLLSLINDILDFSRVHAGQMDFYIKQDDLIPLLDSMIESQQSLAAKSNIKVEFIKRPDKHLCYFDEIRLKQVVTNMLSNAIKYNRKFGWVKISLDEKDDKTLLYIEDSGSGIAADQLEKVFEEFETLGKIASHQKGTGLGMPIARKLIMGMGGTIDLTSEPGVGSKFWIEIPNTKVLSEDLYRERPDIASDFAA